jgi:hypothetical protein
MTRHLSWLVSLLVLAAAADGDAQDCRRQVNNQGFKPGATIGYTVAPSPDGTPFPTGLVACVRQAFDAWTNANRTTALDVRFVPGPGGIVVQRDKAGGLILPPQAGGAWTSPVRSPEGYLVRAHIWLSSDTEAIDNCEGVTKVVLHELGHLHGLADVIGRRGYSVMNRAAGKNDRGARIPRWPTPRDATPALAASRSAGEGRCR